MFRPSCNWLAKVKYLVATLKDLQQKMHLDNHNAKKAMCYSSDTLTVVVS